MTTESLWQCPRFRRIAICSALILLLFGGIILPLLSDLSASRQSGSPHVTINLTGATNIDIAKVRCLHIDNYSHTISFYEKQTDVQLIALSFPTTPAGANSITIRSSCWGEGGLFYDSHFQEEAVILLLPTLNGSVIKQLVMLPDFRQTTSVTTQIAPTSR